MLHLRVQNPKVQLPCMHAEPIIIIILHGSKKPAYFNELICFFHLKNILIEI